MLGADGGAVLDSEEDEEDDSASADEVGIERSAEDAIDIWPEVHDTMGVISDDLAITPSCGRLHRTASQCRRSMKR